MTRSGVRVPLIRPEEDRRVLYTGRAVDMTVPSTQLGGRSGTVTDHAPEQHSFTVLGREDTFEVRPADLIRRGNITGLAFRLLDPNSRGVHWQLTELSAVTGEGRDQWVMHRGTPEGGPITMENGRSTTDYYFVAIRPFGAPETAKDFAERSGSALS